MNGSFGSLRGIMRIKVAYDGFLKIKEILFNQFDIIRHKPPCQTMQYMERGDSVSVLIQTAGKSGKIVLLKQFRVGPFVREGKDETYSMVAGMIDEGETPADAARREMVEEVGVHPSFLEDLGVFYTSPGGTTERTHFFYAEVHEDSVFKINDTREVLEIVTVSEREFKNMVESGEIASAQSALALFLAEEKWLV